jgi:hypothetical protein
MTTSLMRKAESWNGRVRVIPLPVFLLMLVAVGLALVFGVQAWDRAVARPSFQSMSMVTRGPSGFMVDGAPFRFVGVNLNDAAADPGIFQCEDQLTDADIEVGSWFRRIQRESGAQVVRFYAYQSYTDGGTNWQALDRVMSVARQYGVRVIPVLEDQWGYCTHAGYKDASWYAGGYLSPYGNYPLSYRDYVTRVVQRYQAEPAILAWSLMNEAESQSSDGLENADALYTFARDMSAYVKSLDPNHLVTLGVIGAGQPGVEGDNYRRLHALPDIDYAEYHDFNADDQLLSGAPLALNVPLYSAMFTIDGAFQWRTAPYQRHAARVWQTWSGTIPDEATPVTRIGVNFYGSFVGDVYVDEITIGSQVFDFEDGTTQGWSATRPIQFSNAPDPTSADNRALKLSFSESTRGAQLFLPERLELAPGAAVSMRFYADGPGSPDPDNTLAADLYRMQQVGKPLVVAQAWMDTCTAPAGEQLETPQSRAQKFDDKIGAFLNAGGAGYLLWGWDPKEDCGRKFTSGDPLNQVLAGYAQVLSGRLDH